MKKIAISTLDELEILITKFGNDVLFRGQTSLYGSSDIPSVTTSFDRKGCIPNEMLKWSQYAKNVLNTFIGEHKDNSKFIQAILQHYGWRSSYIDCTSNPAVGAWFASHNCPEPCITGEMSEDYQERPVLLRKKVARYDFEEGEGYLYVLDKKVSTHVGLVDLSNMAIKGYSPRTTAQAAWLLGPFRETSVPQECFLAQITANRAVLRDYAASRNLKSTDDLFPPVEKDPILHALLGLPWCEVKTSEYSDFPIPLFKRTLDLPEYQHKPVKIAWPQTAFFRGEKIAETFKSIEGNKNGGIVINVPNIVLFGVNNKKSSMHFPKIEELLKKYSSAMFEINELIQHANMGHLTIYQKGIGVVSHGIDLFEVSALMVEHPGLDMTRVGLNQGWFYRKGIDGLWSHESHEQECKCGSSDVHEEHISALHIVEEFLKDPTAFGDQFG